MTILFHQLISTQNPEILTKHAIIFKEKSLSYQQINEHTQKQAEALVGTNIKPMQRVAVYLPKQIETVCSFLAISQAGGVFVPINPVLKAPQVSYILKDCNVQILITSKNRLLGLKEEIKGCPDLHTVILVDNEVHGSSDDFAVNILCWQEFMGLANNQPLPNIIDSQMVAILYTSGSTGKPKGVVLSHRNIVAGAESVAEYLKITEKEICRGTTIGDKGDPFDFVRKVSILMKEVPHTELLVGMQDFIDDEEGFLKMLAGISDYPFDLFSHSVKNNDYLMHLFESGTIKFDTKEEEDNFLATIFPNK